MDEFGSAVSDDVDAEQLQGVPVENELHQTFEVPDDLAAGDLLVKRTPHLIGNRRGRELFFGLADGRDFRDRVDAVGPHFGDLGLDDLEGMAGRQAALFHGGGGQGRKADHVAGGIDVRDLRLVKFVDLNLTLLVYAKPGGSEIQGVRVRHPPHGEEQHIGHHALSALQARHHPPALIDGDLLELLPKADRHAIRPHVIDEGLHDLLVDEP